MKNLKLKKANIEFYLAGKLVQFTVYHNLPKTFGLSLENAVENWVVRTKKYTAKNLCKYIMSKDFTVVCFTEKQFERLNKMP